MRPITKAITWYIWNMLFGLAPFIIFGYLWISVDDKNLSLTIKGEVFHLIKDLVFLFFCLAMISSLSMDVLFSRHKYPNHIYFFMSAIPCFIFCFVALIYSTLILNKLENVNITHLTIAQCITLFFTTIFCIFTKQNCLRKEAKFDEKF
jgi:hypothetical protein